jgi:hypothetical protein
MERLRTRAILTYCNTQYFFFNFIWWHDKSFRTARRVVSWFCVRKALVLWGELFEFGEEIENTNRATSIITFLRTKLRGKKFWLRERGTRTAFRMERIWFTSIKEANVFHFSIYTTTWAGEKRTMVRAALASERLCRNEKFNLRAYHRYDR